MELRDPQLPPSGLLPWPRERYVRGQCSSLRQPRLPHPVNMMVEVLGVLVDANTFRTFDCETGIDPEHLRGFGSCLLKLSQLRMGARQRDVRPLQTRLAR